MKRCPSCQSTLPADYTHCPRDGSPLISVAEWAEGSLIRGKYRILAKLGEGGMATVYKATHTRFKELRALKVISPTLATDANFVRRFEQEAIVTRKLQHPNAVRVDDIDEAEDGRPFIVMEYVEGRSLKDVIEQEAPMALPRVCSIIEQAASALDAAHAIGLIHRDIKPGNIALVSSSDARMPEAVKILDFGIAKIKEAQLEDSKTHSRLNLTLTDTGMLIGTPAYMSPEQAKGMRGDGLDGRSDLYSLGIVMYQMLTGELPLKADSTIEQLMAHLNTPPQPIRAVRPDISPEVAAVVMRCLEKNRDLRPRNGQALCDELRAATIRPAAAPPPAPPAPILAPVPSQFTEPEDATAPVAEEPEQLTSSRKWLWAVVAAAVVVVGVAAVLLWYQQSLRTEPSAGQQSTAPPGVIATKPSISAGESSIPPSTAGVPPTSKDQPSSQPSSVGLPLKSSAAAKTVQPSPPLVRSSGTAKEIRKPPSTPASQLSPSSVSPAMTKPEKASLPTTAQSPNPPPQAISAPTTRANTAATAPAPSTTPASTPGPAPANPTPAQETVTVYHVGGSVSAPSIISSSQPDYTEEARRVRKEGNVVLSLIVDTSGHARNVRVIRPLGFGLDEKAIEAVNQWRFQPSMKDGKPVNVQINIEVEFRQY